MNLIEAFQVLANEPGPKRSVIIESRITQYAWQTRPGVAYRVQIRIGSDGGPLRCCNEESPSLDVVVERALAAFRQWRADTIAAVSPELVRVSNAIDQLPAA